MIKYDENGCIDLSKCELKDLRDYFAASILEGFVKDGGAGLRSELWEAMYSTIEWYKLKEAKKDK